MKTKDEYLKNREKEREIEQLSREDFLNGIKRLYQVKGTIFIKEIFDEVLDDFSQSKLNDRFA